jgi:hypothetical protein
MSPVELAWRLWGDRRRRNAALRDLAWAVSMVVGVHVSRADSHKVAPERLFMQVAGGGNLDEDEVIS